MAPVLSGKQVVKILKGLGFIQVGQKGSHVKMRGVFKHRQRTAIVPLHRELAPGTLASILKQAGLTSADLIKRK